MTPAEAQLALSITKLHLIRTKRRFLELQAAGVQFSPQQLAALQAAADCVLKHCIRAAVAVGVVPELPGPLVGGNWRGN